MPPRALWRCAVLCCAALLQLQSMLPGLGLRPMVDSSTATTTTISRAPGAPAELPHHVSLSRTVSIQYTQIETLTQQLQRSLRKTRRCGHVGSVPGRGDNLGLGMGGPGPVACCGHHKGGVASRPS